MMRRPGPELRLAVPTQPHAIASRLITDDARTLRKLEIAPRDRPPTGIVHIEIKESPPWPG